MNYPRVSLLSRASLDPFEWLENDGGRSGKGREGGKGRERERERQRELPLIGRMIPANPEKLEWGERQSSVALSEIRGKMDEMPRVQEARKSPANPFGPDEDGQDTLEG